MREVRKGRGLACYDSVIEIMRTGIRIKQWKSATAGSWGKFSAGNQEGNLKNRWEGRIFTGLFDSG